MLYLKTLSKNYIKVQIINRTLETRFVSEI